MSRSKIYDLGKSELQRLVDESNSYADVLKTIGMCAHGGNYKTLQQAIDKFDIDLTQININRQEKLKQTLKPNQAIPLEMIISGNYNKEYKGEVLLRRLIDAGYKERKCEKCGGTEWLGQPIPLQLHHKDGVHNNNTLTNLQALCPNCHSLTDTFAGKNIKKRKKINPHIRKAKTGVSEDGKKLYDGYGNYKILCPICKNNFMNKEAEKCRQCYDEERKVPKISKELLYKTIQDCGSYLKAAEVLGHKRETLANWYKYYVAEDQKKESI